MSIQRLNKLVEEKKKISDYYKNWHDQIRDYKFKHSVSAYFYRRATEPITEKIEEKTKELGKKIEEQSKVGTLVPINQQEPQNIMDQPIPGAIKVPTLPPKERVINLDRGIDYEWIPGELKK